MQSSENNLVVPEETVLQLTAAVKRVAELEKQRRLLARMVFSQAHTLKGAQLLTLMYTDKRLVKEEVALAAV